MKATEVLVEEHRVIERVLNSLEAAVNRLESGQSVPAEVFLTAVDFIRDFADGCHHRKEEGVLFNSMEANGLPDIGCPLGVMLAEHALGRQYNLALLSAAREVQNGNLAATERIIESSRSYIALLRQHIRKEDTHLFPFANAIIPAEQHDRLWADFERIEEAEEGIHTKYLAVADELERQFLN